jgi:hypothetical protein
VKRAFLIALVACSGEKQQPPPAPVPKPPQKPVRIALGDCAPPSTQFESGPKPTDPASLIRPWQTPPVRPTLPDEIKPNPDPPYFPDEHSALREHKADLLACLTKPYGVGLVELGNGEPRVLGVEGDAATCIAGVAKRVPIGNLVEGLRCSFAYGTIPIHDLPSIDVSTKLTDVRARVRALQSAAPVAIIGPILVRAQPTTPMKTVAALVDEIYGVGRVDVIVTTSNTLPFAIDLPAVPIPQGTGTWWADGEFATLHVKRDGVRVNGLEVLRTDVAAELGKQKIESIAISADDDVPLSEVMQVAAIAKVPWRFVAEPQ